MKSAIFKTFLLSLCIIANIHLAHAQTASILPPGKTQYLDNNGKPLTSGKVFNYIPATTNFKTTWQDSAEAVANTNPVILDAGGRAKIYGNGIYRQIVKDRLDNIIWDALTSSTGSGSSGTTSTGDGDLVGTIKPWAGMTAPNQYAFTYGQEVSRTTFATLFTAITSNQAVFCTSASAVLTGLSDTSNFWVGMSLEVSCVAAGFTTVLSKTTSTVTMAVNANVTTNPNARFFPWGRGNGTTTFNLPDFRGLIPLGNNIMGGVASSNIDVPTFGATDPNSSGALGGSKNRTLFVGNLPPHTHTSSSLTDPGHVHTNLNVGISGIATTGATGASATSYSTAASTSSAVTGITISANTGNNASGISTPFPIIPPSRTTNYIIKITPDTNSATASGVTSLGSMIGDIACGSGLLCTGNIISASSGSVPPLTVKIQRVPPLPATYGTATWGVYNPTGSLLCSAINGSAGLGTCLDQAVALAFPYAVGTTSSGYDFEIFGGDEPANGSGSNRGGAATFLNKATMLQFPPIQGGKIRSGAITLSPGLVLDSCEMCDVDFSGAQIAFDGSTPNEIALRLKPTQVTPLDPNFGISPSRLFFTTVVGRTRFDLSGHASANVDYTNLHITEMNWEGVSAGGCGVLMDTPIAGKNMNNNTIRIEQLHGSAGQAATAFCHGTAAPGVGAVLGGSTFNIGISLDSAGATNGFDEWGSNDEIHLQVGGLSTGYALKFESGACKNVAWIWSTSGTATVTDSSSCTGTDANIWYVNGTMFIGGTSIASNGADVVMANGGLFLGTQNSKQGFLVLNWGSGAAGAVITSATNGGSPILQTPNTSGTIPSTATTPVVLNATTGAISCPTCATYVEGTWTPVLSTDATPGTPAYLQQVGSYERIGRQVTVRFALQTSGWTGAPTGNVIITGLPLANNASEFGQCVIGAYVVTGLAASNFGITALIAAATSTILIRQNGTTTSAAITAAQIGTTTQLYGFCNYRV